jgi:hypothetical protein
MAADTAALSFSIPLAKGGLGRHTQRVRWPPIIDLILLNLPIPRLMLVLQRTLANYTINARRLATIFRSISLLFARHLIGTHGIIKG